MDSDTARQFEFLLHRKAGYIHGAVFGAVSDCSSIAECWLFTDVKIVYGYTFGRGSPGACDCFWLHVPFSSLKLFYEDSGLDYQGNASDDSAFDYFLFSGAGAWKADLGRRRGRPVPGFRRGVHF